MRLFIGVLGSFSLLVLFASCASEPAVKVQEPAPEVQESLAAARPQPSERKGIESIRPIESIQPREQQGSEEIPPAVAAEQPQPGDINDTPTQPQEYEPPPESGEQKSADTKIFDDILDGADALKPSYEDSSALQAKKKRELRKKIAKIIKTNTGRTLRFQSLTVKEVEPEQELTKYGERMAKNFIRRIQREPQAREMIALMGGNWKDNPFLALAVGLQLAACKKCMRNTGRFEVSFSLDNGPYGATVVKIVNSENAALQYTKGASYPVSGTVSRIVINDEVETKIFLK